MTPGIIVGLLLGAALVGGSLLLGYNFGWKARNTLGIIAGEMSARLTAPEIKPGRSFDSFGLEDEDDDE